MSGVLKSCLYEGRVRHRRSAPVDHAFDSSLFMLHLDLAELDDVFRGRWLWSSRRPALAWLRRGDHLGDPDVPLDSSVRDLVAERLGRRPTGPIRLLTHLRYFGYCINPVSFYYCWDEADRRLDAIVAEVHNTPWGERHCYVLDAAGGDRGARVHQHRFEKSFHVSPFMGMNQEYRWWLAEPGPRLRIHMQNHEDGRRVFDATMVLERQPITGASLARVLLRYPFITGQVVGAIYLQALRLRLKRCPFHPHPRHRLATEGSTP